MLTWTADDSREMNLWGSPSPALLRAKRIAMGLRTRDVAKHLGLPAVTLRDLERGAQTAQPGFLFLWRDALLRAAEEPAAPSRWLSLGAFVLVVLGLIVAAVILAGDTAAATTPAPVQIDAPRGDSEVALPPAAPAWKLPIPKPTSYAIRGGTYGALIRLGSLTLQARDFGLRRTIEGNIAVDWVNGYDASGASVYLTRELCGGSTPIGAAEAEIIFGVDKQGYLLVGNEAEGTLADPTYSCALSSLRTCVSRGCASCGDAAAGCPCRGDIGGCDPLTRTWCDGTCGGGLTCNTSVTSCRCEPGGAGGQAPQGVKDFGRDIREPE